MSLIDERVKIRERSICSIASKSMYPLNVVVELTVFEDRSHLSLCTNPVERKAPVVTARAARERCMLKYHWSGRP